MNIREAIDRVVSGHSLDMAEASAVMREIMGGEATPAQLGSFLTALRLKGETTQEIAGMASVMREFALRVEVDGTVVDTVGTGGDGSNSFNISTATAFVAAGAGLKVAKHGNRAASSSCGSADILEALGASIELTPDAVARCINEVGVGYMFAQAFHPAMRHAGPGPPGNRHPHRVQHPGAANQPRRRPGPAYRRGLPRTGRDHGRGTAAARLPPRHDCPRPRRLGRNIPFRGHLGLGTSRRPSQGMDPACGRYRPSPYAGRGCPRRRQGAERRHHAPPFPGRARAGARHGPAQQRRCPAGGRPGAHHP